MDIKVYFYLSHFVKFYDGMVNFCATHLIFVQTNPIFVQILIFVQSPQGGRIFENTCFNSMKNK